MDGGARLFINDITGESSIFISICYFCLLEERLKKLPFATRWTQKIGSQKAGSLKNDTVVTKLKLQITHYKKHYSPHYEHRLQVTA